MRVPPFLALVTAVLALAGCTSSSQPGADHVALGPGSSGLAALRAALRQPDSAPAYYLSLGDSLAQGIQPRLTGGDAPTSQGYPDQLAAMLQAGLPNIQLVKLGCSGETTSTMIRGGICRYPAHSQLAQATRFLRSHRGRVALVTLDIGANDPNSCILRAHPPTMLACLAKRVARTENNLSKILRALRAAAGRRVLIVGMTYYVPELGLWRTGRIGREIAVVTDDFAAGVNRLLSVRYRLFGARVADVFGAFHSADFSGVGGQRGQLYRPTVTPPNVAAICALTWMCARPPQGPNEHANAAGYRRIALSFLQAITG
ncbi:MAG TPA: GDSL-type esterase/lipase family protein [Streptosporangiaceae bacterium]|nr:GDSL-type esterase/lipase family protein [Streptosporangiaceae bacterium]